MSFWTEERVETAKRLWLAGLSHGQIAKQMGGVSRNAVIGKLTRLGLSGPERVVRVQPAAPPAREPKTPRPAKPAPPAPVAVSEPAPVAPAPERVERAPAGGVRLVDRRTGQCAFPLGVDAGGEHMCCGDGIAAADRPYCLMYRPTPVMKVVRTRDTSSRRRRSDEVEADFPAGLDGRAA